MDSIFFLEEGDRTVFLLKIMESFGCTYICLWQYFQPSNTFMSLGGIYNGENVVAQRLFEEYKHSWLIMDNGRIPGLAFKNNVPYMELKFADLQSHASNPVQLQFYYEAGIKTTICMGCSIGEIEFGMTSSPQVNLEMGMKNLFPEYFSTRLVLARPQTLLTNIDQNRPSPSSSFSLDSPGEYSSLLFNVATTSYVPDAFPEQTVRPVSTSAMPFHQQQPIQTLTQLRGIQFPGVETDDAALTRAYLAVMTSPSSSSSSHQSRENIDVPITDYHYQKSTAFRRFGPGLGRPSNVQIGTSRTIRRENILRRSIIFFRNLDMMRRKEQIQANQRALTSTQVHHMISERKRREKLNDSFQLLRSLLPPGTKKDKASVLASTTEYITCLKDQVEELSKKNEIMLNAQALDKSSMMKSNDVGDGNDERVVVEIIKNVSSESESRTVELQVSVRSGECNVLDLATRLLEFLKTQDNLSLQSVAANTRPSMVTHVSLTITIQGSEWDESGFEEAVKRVVDDLT
ncbi:putative transcription factor bHLH041 isoform X1 [Solanum lycopersicum]|uniref:putative transcription factor bHLH041 isoform X1 n=1 Tax=Solanum lycopersicum TaxID=4081 RepID=UPI000532BD29|nr:putative transcription factor bHLH041 [Solanum lycopersicum]